MSWRLTATNHSNLAEAQLASKRRTNNKTHFKGTLFKQTTITAESQRGAAAVQTFRVSERSLID